MIYKFEVFGRAKDIDLDNVMRKVNKTFQEVIKDDSVRVLWNYSMGIISFEGPETFTEEDIKKITEITKTVFGERYTDITLERILK